MFFSSTSWLKNWGTFFPIKHWTGVTGYIMMVTVYFSKFYLKNKIEYLSSLLVAISYWFSRWIDTDFWRKYQNRSREKGWGGLQQKCQKSIGDRIITDLVILMIFVAGVIFYLTRRNLRWNQICSQWKFFFFLRLWIIGH